MRWMFKKQYTYCIWHSLWTHVRFTVSPNNCREWVCDYQRGHLIWFNPTTQTSTAHLLFLAFPSDKENGPATVNTQVLTLTHVVFVCVYMTNRWTVMVTSVHCMVRWVCDVSVIVHCASGDLRPSAGARRRDSRAIQTGENFDIDRWRGSFLFRNDRENQYSVMCLMAFDSSFVSESIKHHREKICGCPEHIEIKKKFTPCFQNCICVTFQYKYKNITINGVWL